METKQDSMVDSHSELVAVKSRLSRWVTSLGPPNRNRLREEIPKPTISTRKFTARSRLQQATQVMGCPCIIQLKIQLLIWEAWPHRDYCRSRLLWSIRCRINKSNKTMCPPLSSTMIHWASLPTAAVEEPLVEKLKINWETWDSLVQKSKCDLEIRNECKILIDRVSDDKLRLLYDLLIKFWQRFSYNLKKYFKKEYSNKFSSRF